MPVGHTRSTQWHHDHFVNDRVAPTHCPRDQEHFEKLGVVVHTCDLRAGRWRQKDSEFQDSWATYTVRPCLKYQQNHQLLLGREGEVFGGTMHSQHEQALSYGYRVDIFTECVSDPGSEVEVHILHSKVDLASKFSQHSPPCMLKFFSA